MNLHEKAEAAAAVARRAGAMLREHGSIEVSRKSANDFVTQMDVASERLIRDELLSRYPEDAFFGEEGGGSLVTDGRWIVDPIDGTYSFLRGHRCYTISIAYQYMGRLVIGCVYAPEEDELFLAIDNEGATLNGRPIRVSDTAQPGDVLAHFGYGHRVPELRERMMPVMDRVFHSVSDLRRYGSAAYALSCVACGRSDVFFEVGLNLYDIAAGVVLVREAGGSVTGWQPDEDCLVTGSVLAGNGRVNESMRAILLGR